MVENFGFYPFYLVVFSAINADNHRDNPVHLKTVRIAFYHFFRVVTDDFYLHTAAINFKLFRKNTIRPIIQDVSVSKDIYSTILIDVLDSTIR